MTQPITACRRNAEDLRAGTKVRDRFLLDRINMARDHSTVHVEPQLALMDAANPAQAHLVLPDLAISGARGAHDLVCALDRLPEFRDLPHRLSGRLAHVEDFRFRNHLSRYTAAFGLKPFVEGYRFEEDRKCSHPLLRRGSFPVFVSKAFPPEAATLPMTVNR